MSNPRQVQIPIHPQMLQGLLGGPMPAQKPPEVVEVMTTLGERMAFNQDAIEFVKEDQQYVAIKIKNCGAPYRLAMTYDDFLREINVTPRVLGSKE